MNPLNFFMPQEEQKPQGSDLLLNTIQGALNPKPQDPQEALEAIEAPDQYVNKRINQMIYGTEQPTKKGKALSFLTNLLAGAAVGKDYIAPQTRARELAMNEYKMMQTNQSARINEWKAAQQAALNAQNQQRLMFAQESLNNYRTVEQTRKEEELKIKQDAEKRQRDALEFQDRWKNREIKTREDRLAWDKDVEDFKRNYGDLRGLEGLYTAKSLQAGRPLDEILDEISLRKAIGQVRTTAGQTQLIQGTDEYGQVTTQQIQKPPVTSGPIRGMNYLFGQGGMKSPLTPPQQVQSRHGEENIQQNVQHIQAGKPVQIETGNNQTRPVSVPMFKDRASADKMAFVTNSYQMANSVAAGMLDMAASGELQKTFDYFKNLGWLGGLDMWGMLDVNRMMREGGKRYGLLGDQVSPKVLTTLNEIYEGFSKKVYSETGKQINLLEWELAQRSWPNIKQEPQLALNNALFQKAMISAAFWKSQEVLTGKITVEQARRIDTQKKARETINRLLPDVLAGRLRPDEALAELEPDKLYATEIQKVKGGAPYVPPVSNPAGRRRVRLGQ